MRIAVTGAKGQMGTNVLKVAEKKDIPVELAVDQEKAEYRGIEVKQDKLLPTLLQKNNVDVLIDFTVPEATTKYIEAALKTQTPIVIGTTGFTEGQMQKIKKAAEEIPVLKASNFSTSINVMRKLVREAAETLDDYDIEVTETHHNRKKDAPSGTASSFLEEIRKTREFQEVHGRKGEAPRENGEIGVHAKRAGDIRGVHEVLFAGDDEVMRIEHRNESREVFASGALKSAKWLENKQPGFYSFSEVI